MCVLHHKIDVRFAPQINDSKNGTGCRSKNQYERERRVARETKNSLMSARPTRIGRSESYVTTKKKVSHA
jgi:hypothetical protein